MEEKQVDLLCRTSTRRRVAVVGATSAMVFGIASVSGCGGSGVVTRGLPAVTRATGTPRAQPSTSTPVATGAGPTAAGSPVQSDCPKVSEALALALTANGGTLPSDVSIDPTTMICVPGWAAGLLVSPSVGIAHVVFRTVGGTWQLYVMGTGLCDDPEGKQQMAQAPAPIRSAAAC